MKEKTKRKIHKRLRRISSSSSGSTTESYSTPAHIRRRSQSSSGSTTEPYYTPAERPRRRRGASSRASSEEVVRRGLNAPLEAEESYVHYTCEESIDEQLDSIEQARTFYEAESKEMDDSINHRIALSSDAESVEIDAKPV